jgi:LysM repeat protein/ABC-type branched-subunit amino acid transport system substrate-binding protein
MGVNFRVLSFVFLLFTSACLFGQGEVKHLIHVVKPGETLYGIAQTYSISIEELMQFNEEINRMKAIRPGARLLVPDRRAQEPERVDPNNIASVDSPQIEFIYHEVQLQETLYSLSKQYGISTQALIDENPTIETKGLKAGFILRVPKKKARTAQEFIAQNDEKYFLHPVQVRETAYSLGKRYKITIDSLYILNPEMKAGLKLGQLLRLPKNRSRYGTDIAALIPPKNEASGVNDPLVANEPGPKDTNSSDSDFVLYKVKSGDTFFNLKQRYFVEGSELVAINPELEKGLIVGNYIIIPKKNEAAEINWLENILNKAESADEIKIQDVSGETVVKKDNLNTPEKKIDSLSSSKNEKDSLLVDTTKEYRVALMLPFRSSRYADSLDVYRFFPHRDTEMSSQFYFGLKLAADSMAKRGMRLNLRLFDTEGELSRTKDFVEDLEALEPDLIIGPAYNRNAEYIADEMKEKGIPVISPLSKSVDISDRSNLIKMVPDDEAKAGTIADLLNSKFATANVLFAHCGKNDQEKVVEEVMARLEPREDAFVKAMSDCDELTNPLVLNENLAQIGLNVVVLMSDDAVFISDIISKLYSLKDTSIFLIGSPAILKSPTVEFSYLNALHFTTYEVINTNYNNKATQAFVQKFRTQFKDEPNSYAFQGFDAGLYFLEVLWKSGPYFLESLERQEKLSSGYQFEREGEDGLRNGFFFHSAIESYELQRIKY